MPLLPQRDRSRQLRNRIAAQDRESISRRGRAHMLYAPFHGLTVFVLSVIAFLICDELLEALGLRDGPADALLAVIGVVGMICVAPVPDVVPSDSGWQLPIGMLASFCCGWAVNRIRPQWGTRRWLIATTTLLVGLSTIAHLVWRKTGHDWPDWLAFIRDLV